MTHLLKIDLSGGIKNRSFNRAPQYFEFVDDVGSVTRGVLTTL